MTTRNSSQPDRQPGQTAKPHAGEPVNINSDKISRNPIFQSSEGIYCFGLDEPVSIDLPEEEQITLFLEHGYLVECNQAYAKMYGLSSPDEISGSRLKDLLIIDEHLNAEYIRSFIRNNYNLTDFLSVERNIHGESKYFLNNISGMIHDGKIHQAWGAQRDITEKIIAERALRETEEFNRKLFEEAPFSVIVIDLKGNIIKANKAAFTLHAVPPDTDLNGMNIYEWVAPPSVDAVRRGFINLVNNIDTIEYEVLLKKGDGQVFEAEISARLIHDSNGNPKFGMIITKDLSPLRKKIAELKESELSYRKLFDNVADAIYIQDTEGSFIDVNEGAVKLYGYPKEDFIGKTPEFLSAPGHNNFEELALKLKLAMAGEPQIFEFWGKKSDGTVFPKEVRVSKSFYRGADVILATATDIQARKRDEALKNAIYRISQAGIKSKTIHEFYSLIHSIILEVIDAPNLYIALLSEDSLKLRFVFWRDEIETNPVERRLRKGLSEYVINNKTSLVADAIKITRLINEGHIDPGGGLPEIWMGVPLLDENDQAFGVVAAQSYSSKSPLSKDDLPVLDYLTQQLAIVIKRKKAEERARKLYKGVEQSPSAIFITDLIGNIEYCNPKFSQLTGYKYEDVHEINFRKFKSGLRDNSVFIQLWGAITTGNEWKGEIKNQNKSGVDYWESLSMSPIKDDNGEITHFLGVSEDITSRKKIMEELISAKEKAEEVMRLKSNFLANMSHETRTPMIAILGYSELLKEMTDDPAMVDMVDSIYQSATRLLNTLNMILDFSRLESNKQEINLEPVDLGQFVSDNIRSYIESAKDKSLTFNLVAPDIQMVALVDRQIIISVLSNLLSNAIKYTATGGITLSLRKDIRDDGSVWIEISVKDTGIGISEENQKVIFEEFRQASEGFGRFYEGTGLGLTITKKFINLLDGEIRLKSKPGAGSVFTVSFREFKGSIQSDSNAEPGTTGKELKEKPGSRRILIVDDDKPTCNLIRLLLSTRYNVEYALNPENALALIESYSFDLILLDINLGSGISGIDLLNKFKADTRFSTVPVVAITAYTTMGDKKKFTSMGFADFLPKPFSRAELHRVVKETLLKA